MNTIKTHMAHIFQKLGAVNRNDAISQVGPSACCDRTSHRPLIGLGRRLGHQDGSGYRRAITVRITRAEMYTVTPTITHSETAEKCW